MIKFIERESLILAWMEEHTMIRIEAIEILFENMTYYFVFAAHYVNSRQR